MKSQTQRPISWPQIFYLTFFGILVIVYLYFRPSWGFMDDHACLESSTAFWRGTLSWSDMVLQDMQGHGRFRPIYYLWIVYAYVIPYPLVLYLLILLSGAVILLYWGSLIDKLFPQGLPSSFNQYLYPLTFFAFLPFWNIFMYISVQEKFVFLFGTLSFYFLFKSYEQDSFKNLILALILALTGMLGKETGVVFFLTYAVYAFLDLAFLKKNMKISFWLLIVTLAAGLSYILFIKHILGHYTAAYKSNLSLAILVTRLGEAPALIKAIFGFSALTTAGAFWTCFLKRNNFHPLFIICPLWVLIYICLLLPWGFQNYLLAPLGTFVMVVIYFWLVAFLPKGKSAIIFLQIVTVLLALLILGEVIIPRISKMADKSKVVVKIKELSRHESYFFYPPNYLETFDALQSFSSAKMSYQSHIKDTELNDQARNYLIMNDEAGNVMLENVAASERIYRNGTWEIWTLKKQRGEKRAIRIAFTPNALQKIKDFIKNL